MSAIRRALWYVVLGTWPVVVVIRAIRRSSPPMTGDDCGDEDLLEDVAATVAEHEAKMRVLFRALARICDANGFPVPQVPGQQRPDLHVIRGNREAG